MKRTIGSYLPITVGEDRCEAFIPTPLPPKPALRLTVADHRLIERANRAVGRLDAMTEMLPDTAMFIYAYVRKEALVSSQIEGTQSSFSDLLLYESDQAPGVPLDDVREVSDYVAALSHGVERMRSGFPISTRLIREIHAILLRGGRGSDKAPGEFRRTQVWVGGTRPGRAKFIPPPADRVAQCMSDWEKFLHGEPIETPTLVKAALAHVQFETIHPFLDGNGRLGRMLVTLLLCSEGALSEPILYLSLFLKLNRQDYYDHLQRVRVTGDWESWIRFFVRGVLETAEEGIRSTRRILELFQQDRRKLEGLGKAAATAFRVHELIQRKPVVEVQRLANTLGLSFPAVNNTLAKMKQLRIVSELTGQRRNRVFAYAPFVQLLSEGAEPLRS